MRLLRFRQYMVHGYYRIIVLLSQGGKGTDWRPETEDGGLFHPSFQDSMVHCTWGISIITIPEEYTERKLAGVHCICWCQIYTAHTPWVKTTKKSELGFI